MLRQLRNQNTPLGNRRRIRRHPFVAGVFSQLLSQFLSYQLGGEKAPGAKGIATTTIGYKRIIPLNGSTAHSYDDGFKVRALRVKINDSKACPLIQSLAVF